MLQPIRLFLFVITLSSISLACGLCSIYSPLTLTTLEIHNNEKKIQFLDVKLKLTKEFTRSLKKVYDKDGNNILNKKELKEIGSVFLDYAKPKNYLLKIYYSHLPSSKNERKFKVKNFKSYIESDILHISYRVMLDFVFRDDYFLDVQIEDDEAFFMIQIANANFVSYPKMLKEQRPNRVVFNLQKSNAKVVVKDTANETYMKVEPVKKEVVNKEPVKETTSYLDTFSQLLKKYLLEVEAGNYGSLFILLLVAFIYGVVHAIGPGHSKVFAFSYFSLYKTSLVKAFLITQASAFVHIIGALILVLISMFVLESILNNFIDNSVVILTQVSAVLMMLLALYILFTRIKHDSCACSTCCSSKTQSVSFTTQAPNNKLQQNRVKKPNKIKDLWFIITSGLIPCPGTVLLFIYAFTLNTYVAVILASLMISFGMGLILFISAFFGLGVNKVSNLSHGLARAVAIGAPLFMFVLGGILFFGTSWLDLN